jgi:Ubiquitin family
MDFLGSRCCQPGCNCGNEFLPFKCPACEMLFCSDHRSRFVHEPCKSAITTSVIDPSTGCVTDSASQAAEAKQMISNVIDRHSTLLTTGAKCHYGYHIKSSPIPAGIIASEGFSTKLAQLRDIGMKTSNIKTRKICDKTREILLKSKSSGNCDIDADERIYLSIAFRPICTEESSNTHQTADVTNDRIHVFFKKTSTLGEVLHQIAKKYTNFCFGCPVVPDGWSLGISTSDTPNWQDWDRSAPVGTLLLDFEEIIVSPVPTIDVVAAQKVHENNRQHPVVESSSKVEPCEVKCSEGRSFRKGETARYLRSTKSQEDDGVDGKKLSDEDYELVRVVDVHMDDFPNVYYTVQFHASGCERQTDSAHLAEHTAIVNVIAKCAGTSLQLQIVHAGKNFDLSDRIGDDNTISELKAAVASLTDVPADGQKLIYKGTVLKNDTQKLKDTKISRGAKITVIGTASSRK